MLAIVAPENALNAEATPSARPAENASHGTGETHFRADPAAPAPALALDHVTVPVSPANAPVTSTSMAKTATDANPTTGDSTLEEDANRADVERALYPLNVTWRQVNAVVCPASEDKTAINAIMDIGTLDLKDVKSALVTIWEVVEDATPRPADVSAFQVSLDLAVTDAKIDGFSSKMSAANSATSAFTSCWTTWTR